MGNIEGVLYLGRNRLGHPLFLYNPSSDTSDYPQCKRILLGVEGMKEPIVFIGVLCVAVVFCFVSIVLIFREL